MRLDDVDNGGTGFWRDVEADDEVLVKFRQVSFTFPDMNVCADVDKRLRWVADGFAILLELKDAVVDIVGVVQWKVAVDRFGAPNLGRNIDDKGPGMGCEVRHRVGRLGLRDKSRHLVTRRQAGIEK